VAASVNALRVPAVVRTDPTGLWFRVIAGPFASREAAQAAQEQITRGGFEGTQISPVVPEAR
jgi:cell division protein FtsN